MRQRPHSKGVHRDRAAGDKRPTLAWKVHVNGGESGGRTTVMRKGPPSVGVPAGAAGGSHHAQRAMRSKEARGRGPAVCGNEDKTALESAPAEVSFSSGGGWGAFGEDGRAHLGRECCAMMTNSAGGIKGHASSMASMTNGTLPSWVDTRQWCAWAGSDGHLRYLCLLK
jgi:hypothetical protein